VQVARDFLQLFELSGDFNFFWSTRSGIQALAASFFENLPIEPINWHIDHRLNKIPVQQIQALLASYPSNAQLLAIRVALPVVSLPLEPCKRQVHDKMI